LIKELLPELDFPMINMLVFVRIFRRKTWILLAVKEEVDLKESSLTSFRIFRISLEYSEFTSKGVSLYLIRKHPLVYYSN